MTRPHHRLSAAQQAGIVAAIFLAHGALGWVLLQVDAVRETLTAAAPIMFSLVEPETKPPVPPPPRPIPKVAPPAPVIATTAATPTSDFVVAESEPEIPSVTATPAVAQPEPAPAPPAPKLIPASAIEYRVPPPLEYPRASRKLRESGRAIVRVFVDETGLPRVVQLRTSSGFQRLDEAAMAAVEKARFKPYMENGQATAGWALIPLDFDLET